MTTVPLNVEALRKDFPLLTRTVHDRPIVYLDSASSALQPQSVITAMRATTRRRTPTCTAASMPPPKRRPASTSRRGSPGPLHWIE